MKKTRWLKVINLLILSFIFIPFAFAQEDEGELNFGKSNLFQGNAPVYMWQISPYNDVLKLSFNAESPNVYEISGVQETNHYKYPVFGSAVKNNEGIWMINIVTINAETGFIRHRSAYLNNFPNGYWVNINGDSGDFIFVGQGSISTKANPLIKGPCENSKGCK